MNDGSGSLVPISLKLLRSKLLHFSKNLFGLKINKKHFIDHLKKLFKNYHLSGTFKENLFIELALFCEKYAIDIIEPIGNFYKIDINNLKKIKINEIINSKCEYILFYKESKDQLYGYAKALDLINILNNFSLNKYNIKNIINKPIFSSISSSLLDITEELHKNNRDLSVIVNEYGENIGVITLDILLKQILSNKLNNKSSYNKTCYFDNNNNLIVQGKTKISYIESILNISLKDFTKEYDTIGGVITSIAEKLPVKGEIISLKSNLKAEILSSTPRVIKEIKLIYYK